VIEESRFQRFECSLEPGRLEPQCIARALELGDVHVSAGISGLAVASTCAQLEHGVLGGRPAEREICVARLPARRDLVSVAVFVIVGFGPIRTESRVADFCTADHIEELIVAAEGTGQRVRMQPKVALAEALARSIAFETHGAGGAARSP